MSGVGSTANRREAPRLLPTILLLQITAQNTGLCIIDVVNVFNLFKLFIG